MTNGYVDREVNSECSDNERVNGTKIPSINISAITPDTSILCPIRYVYNYLPQKTEWLKPQQIFVPTLCSDAAITNGITLYPKAANIPFHTGLGTVRQTKHWRAAEQAARELLELFAQDQSCQDIVLANGQSMASLARSQLASSIMDSYTRFSIYMFPNADEKRTRLLAQSIILIFIFDDMWESVSSTMGETIRDDFIARLQGHVSLPRTDTPLQKRINEISRGFRAGDEEDGNGGAEVLQKLIEFCGHNHPPQDFSNVREYLNYRYDDIGNGYTCACTKFSIRSSVDLRSKHLERFLRCHGDQISISNDIASYDKEKRHYLAGKAASIINVVHVIKEIERVDDEAAKSMAYAWLLWTENEIIKELDAMKRRDALSLEEWKFVDAALVTAAGNTFTSVVMSRYGGESARIDA